MLKYFVNAIKNFAWRIDPGYFTLKLALKTVLALFVSLYLVRNDAFITKLFASYTAVIAMQGIDAKVWRYRVLHILIFDLLFCLSFSLGFLVAKSHLASAIILACLGFGINYIRRFNLERSIAPM